MEETSKETRNPRRSGCTHEAHRNYLENTAILPREIRRVRNKLYIGMPVAILDPKKYPDDIGDRIVRTSVTGIYPHVVTFMFGYSATMYEMCLWFRDRSKPIGTNYSRTEMAKHEVNYTAPVGMGVYTSGERKKRVKKRRPAEF